MRRRRGGFESDDEMKMMELIYMNPVLYSYATLGYEE